MGRRGRVSAARHGSKVKSSDADVSFCFALAGLEAIWKACVYYEQGFWEAGRPWK